MVDYSEDRERTPIYRIMAKLDKIIELLELRNGIAVARNEMLEGVKCISPCLCGEHKTDESTGGWFCPVHGHCS